MPEYLKRDIAKVLLKPPRTIEFWTSSGLVIPDIEPSQGKGKPRVYSGRNLLEFGMIEIMSRMDISLDTIKNIMEVLRERKWVPDPDVTVPHDMTEAEKKEWVDKNTVKIHGFWESDFWGVSSEVVYVEMKGLTRAQRIPYSFSEWFILHKNKSIFDVEKKLSPWMLKGPIGTIIYLGKIKLMAMRLIFGLE